MVDSEKVVVGVLSEGDVLRALVEDISIYASVRTILSPTFCFSRDRNIREGLEFLRKRGATLIPVVNEHFELEDVVTVQDILENITFGNG